MKKSTLMLAALLGLATALHAQVTSTDRTFTADGTSDLKLNTNTTATARFTILDANRFVGIGTTPLEMFHVSPNMLVIIVPTI